MGIPSADIKVLWARAAGMCSNPDCREDITLTVSNNTFNIGEMAHIIAKRPRGPRGIKHGGEDDYSNLILLCPSCHRMVDKAPNGHFSEKRLRQWKYDHEKDIRARVAGAKFECLTALKAAVHKKLTENHFLWKELGPQSEIATSDPSSNAATTWALRKLDTIIPNNSYIISSIERNSNLLTSADYSAFVKFKTHARAFKENQYDRLDYYPEFPGEFAERFSCE
jgi:hypothetical protein